jgi:hypothetical protein
MVRTDAMVTDHIARHTRLRLENARRQGATDTSARDRDPDTPESRISP